MRVSGALQPSSSNCMLDDSHAVDWRVSLKGVFKELEQAKNALEDIESRADQVALAKKDFYKTLGMLKKNESAIKAKFDAAALSLGHFLSNLKNMSPEAISESDHNVRRKQLCANKQEDGTSPNFDPVVTEIENMINIGPAFLFGLEVSDALKSKVNLVYLRGKIRMLLDYDNNLSRHGIIFSEKQSIFKKIKKIRSELMGLLGNFFGEFNDIKLMTSLVSRYSSCEKLVFGKGGEKSDNDRRKLINFFTCSVFSWNFYNCNPFHLNLSFLDVANKMLLEVAGRRNNGGFLCFYDNSKRAVKDRDVFFKELCVFFDAFKLLHVSDGGPSKKTKSRNFSQLFLKELDVIQPKMLSYTEFIVDAENSGLIVNAEGKRALGECDTNMGDLFDLLSAIKSCLEKNNFDWTRQIRVGPSLAR